ncbi:MAG: acyl-CoA thioesterase [Muribaculaceae bacterium]|nr:acyl-CoA thioesterase [Muribaculaceae bacterium]
MSEAKEKKQDVKAGESNCPFHHSMPIQIRFNDVDTLGHVNNSIYFSFFDLGKANYFTAVKGGSVDWDKVDIVVANINCDFLAPMFFYEEIEVETQVVEIHTSSFKMFQRLINKHTGSVKCCCSTIMVGFDVKNQTSAPLSEDWIEGLNKFEERELRVKK